MSVKELFFIKKKWLEIFGEGMLINEVGANFNLNKLIEAQEATKKVVLAVSEKVFINMTEADGIELINLEFKKLGDIKFWHPHKFRIGKNTLKSFREESESGVRLNSGDHFFIDVGPVLFEHEGDFGDTFIFGKNEKVQQLRDIAHELFNITKAEFLERKLSGHDLYNFLNSEAEKRNAILNLNTLGHRVGDFPHHLFYRGKLADVKDSILPNLWVLEVQIADRELKHGAFYEDILFNL
jgi:hypothetical protein